MPKPSTIDIWCGRCDNLILREPACPACGWKRPPSPAASVGKQLWREPAEPTVCTGLTLVGDTLLFGTGDGRVHAWDKSTGKEQEGWPFQLPDGWAAMEQLAVAEGLVIVAPNDIRPRHRAAKAPAAVDAPVADKTVIAIDLRTGKPRWRYPTNAVRLSAPLAHNNCVYTVASDRVCHAVDLRGTKVWSRSLPGFARCAPAADDNRLYVVCPAPMASTALLVAIPLREDALPWQWTAPAEIYTPVVAGDEVYVTCKDKHLYVLDAASGEQRWQVAFAGDLMASPVISGKRVFLADRGRLRDGTPRQAYAVDRTTHKVVWHQPIEGKALTAPVAASGVVYLGCHDGLVHAFDELNGNPLWPPLAVGKPLGDVVRVECRLWLASDGDSLWVGAEEGHVTALAVRVKELVDEDVALVLNGQYVEAAAIYAQRGQWYRAAQLYQKGGAMAEAADAYERARTWAKARDIYRALKQPLKVAKMSVRLKDWPAAAAACEEAGDYAAAGRYYEQSSNLSKAAEMYERAAGEAKNKGDEAEARKLYKKAADIAYGRELWYQAERLYGVASDSQGELNCCIKQNNWGRMAPLYVQIAQQLEGKQPIDEIAVADLYSLAEDIYNKLGYQERCELCHAKVLLYRKLPEMVFVSAEGRFVCDSKNKLTMNLKNIGHGPALDTTVTLVGDFDGDLKKIHHWRVEPEATQKIEFRLTPNKCGEATALDIRVVCKDEKGNEFPVDPVPYDIPVQSAKDGEAKPQMFVMLGNIENYQPGSTREGVSILRVADRGQRSGVQLGVSAQDEQSELDALSKSVMQQLARAKFVQPPASADKPEPPTTDHAADDKATAPGVSDGPICPLCGAALGQSTDRCPSSSCKTRLCPHCQNPLAEDMTIKFCPTCRKPLQP